MAQMISQVMLNGSTLTVEAVDDQNRVSRWALDWATMQAGGRTAVLAACTGDPQDVAPPAWVQQLVGVAL